jgi:hypothetical protein
MGYYTPLLVQVKGERERKWQGDNEYAEEEGSDLN